MCEEGCIQHEGVLRGGNQGAVKMETIVQQQQQQDNSSVIATAGFIC